MAITHQDSRYRNGNLSWTLWLIACSWSPLRVLYEQRSAATLFNDFAIISWCFCSSVVSAAASTIVVFICKTSGKSTSNMLLSFKQLKRYALVSIPADKEQTSFVYSVTFFAKWNQLASEGWAIKMLGEIWGVSCGGQSMSIQCSISMLSP